MKNLEKLTKEMAIKEVADIRNIASDDEAAHGEMKISYTIGLYVV